MRTVQFIKSSCGSTIADRIECAEVFLSRLRGLLGHSELRPGEGLWIKPSSGVHTFWMRFTIDAVGLDRDMRVIRLWPNLGPQRVTGVCLQVHSVLELAAGEIEARGLVMGEVLSVREI